MSDRAAVLIIADDLTGANATAAGFARAGLRAATVGADQDAAVITDYADRYDVVVATTDSRHLPPAEAAARATAAVEAGWPVRLVGNRVDSTLRGNLGASTEAVLAAVARASGRRTVALCQAAHPAAGRQTVNGTQLLDGIRLEDTELAHDPRSPLDESRIVALLRRQTALPTAHLGLSVVTGDDATLRATLARHVDDEAAIIIADALTLDHVDRVSHAAAAIDVAWVSVDPGPGSLAMATALGLRATGGRRPILVASGSATEVTRSQLAALRDQRTVVSVEPQYRDRTTLDVPATATALTTALRRATPDDVVALATVWSADDVVALTPADAARLPRDLATATRLSLTDTTADGIFVTGGDVAAAMLAELGATGFDVEGELDPLAVAGNLVSGRWAGLPIVTKGGLVGGADSIVTGVNHLRATADTLRRRVHTVLPGGIR